MASLALARGQPVLALALGLAASAGAGLGLAAAGLGAAAAGIALLAATLALLALVVALNALLRLDGLGGDGLVGAAGVLGSSLLLLARALGLLRAHGATAADDPALLDGLELAGFVLAAVWAARSGWALRRLVGPPVLLGWLSLGAAVATVLLAGLGYASDRIGGGDSGLLVDALPFAPLGSWGALLAGVATFGRGSVGEPQNE
ncbi:MAG: hypothetical protein ABR599_02780 [Gemmatimonadota bacterium]